MLQVLSSLKKVKLIFKIGDGCRLFQTTAFSFLSKFCFIPQHLAISNFSVFPKKKIEKFSFSKNKIFIVEKYAVSACLCGKNCRYDGSNKLDESIRDFASKNHALLICPECMVFPSVHPPSEIRASDRRVFSEMGEDVTEKFYEAAQKILDLCLKNGVNKVILKEKSPSCGVYKIYDGTFTGTLIDGCGITTELLIKNGIQVISEDDFHYERRLF